MSHQFHLVINNPTYEDDERILRYLDKEYENDFKDYRLVMETAPTTGTEHYHIYVQYKNKKSFAYMHQHFPRAHIEFYKGASKNIDEYLDKQSLDEKSTEEYCQKTWHNSIKIQGSPLTLAHRVKGPPLPLEVGNIDLKFSE